MVKISQRLHKLTRNLESEQSFVPIANDRLMFHYFLPVTGMELFSQTAIDSLVKFSA